MGFFHILMFINFLPSKVKIKQSVLKLPYVSVCACAVVWMRNILHRFMYLNAWSPVDGVCLGRLWNFSDGSLLRKVHHWGSFRVRASPHFQFALSVSYMWLRCDLSASCSCHQAHPPLWTSSVWTQPKETHFVSLSCFRSECVLSPRQKVANAACLLLCIPPPWGNFCTLWRFVTQIVLIKKLNGQ